LYRLWQTDRQTHRHVVTARTALYTASRWEKGVCCAKVSNRHTIVSLFLSLTAATKLLISTQNVCLPGLVVVFAWLTPTATQISSSLAAVSYLKTATISYVMSCKTSNLSVTQLSETSVAWTIAERPRHTVCQLKSSQLQQLYRNRILQLLQ